MLDLVALRTLLSSCWPALVEHDGAIFLADSLPVAGLDLHGFPDLTAAEAFYNHIHIVDIVTSSTTLSKTDDPTTDILETMNAHTLLADIAHIIANMWSTKLQHDYPNLRFRLYLTF